MKKFINKGILVMVMMMLVVSFVGAQAKYAIVFKNTGNPYGEKQMAGFKAGIEAQGFEAILRAPDQPTAEAQIQIIEQLIAQKVASICIVGNDFDALQPVLKKATAAGIKVLSLDSSVNPAARLTHINQADSVKIGQTLVQAAYDMIGGKGEIAILSATSQASNQNLWIDYMKAELKLPKYANVKLVKIAYGDDLRDKSVSETEALLKAYPNLKCIVITDKKLIGKVFITGLGLPSEMASYIENGACPYMFLWNPIDVGYLGAYAATALVKGTIKGAIGDKFAAGRLGNYVITKAPDGGTEVLLGPPFKFEKSNIADWKTVY